MTIGGFEQSTVVDCFLKHDDGFTFQEIYMQSKRPHSVQNISSQESQPCDLGDPSTWASSTVVGTCLFTNHAPVCCSIPLQSPPFHFLPKTLCHPSSATAAAAATTLPQLAMHVIYKPPVLSAAPQLPADIAHHVHRRREHPSFPIQHVQGPKPPPWQLSIPNGWRLTRRHHRRR